MADWQERSISLFYTWVQTQWEEEDDDDMDLIVRVRSGMEMDVSSASHIPCPILAITFFFVVKSRYTRVINIGV